MSTNLGRDTSCTTSLRTGRFVTGARLVGEAAYRRITTPRGALRGAEEEDDYGIDVTELIGSIATKSIEAVLPQRIRAELEKDSRILSVSIDALVTTAVNGATSVEITIDATTDAGPFTLVVRASAVTAELLGINAELEEAA